MKRFNENVAKLYDAYHNNTLDAFSCEACAVGNIVGHGFWMGFLPDPLYLGEFKPNSTCGDSYPTNADYSPEELKEIEYLFLSAFNGVKDNSEGRTNKERQFNGLCAVIEYLAELDGVVNPFDFSNLFNEDKKVSGKELSLVCF